MDDKNIYAVKWHVRNMEWLTENDTIASVCEASARWDFVALMEDRGFELGEFVIVNVSLSVSSSDKRALF